MKRLLSLLLALTLASLTLAQDTPKPTAAKPEDVKSIDSIILALYDVISGPAGQKRDWDRMRSLFMPGARMGAIYRVGQDNYEPHGTDVEGYIKASAPLLEERGFFETEIGRHVDRYGNLVQVFSAYESKGKKEDPKPFQRGINSIQLINDGTRWWIVNIFWQPEDKDHPIPAEWLKKS